MCYITIRSDKGFKAELHRSSSSYTGFALILIGSILCPSRVFPSALGVNFHQFNVFLLLWCISL